MLVNAPDLSQPIFRPEGQAAIVAAQNAELVIGISTAHTTPALAATIVRRAMKGVQTHYRGRRTVILNAYSGKSNALPSALQALHNPQLPVISQRYTGTLGYGAAIRAMLHGAVQLNPKAILILDAGSNSLTPQWVPALLTPVLKHGADLTKPRYHWHLPHGGLNDLLYYPLMRAVWGVSLSQPGAGDYALSPTFARALLAQDVWQTEVARAGLETWMSTFAITQGWQMAQSALGEKQSNVSLSPNQKLTLFKEGVGVLWRQISLRQAHWRTKKPKSLPTLTQFGQPDQPTGQPISPSDVTPLIKAFTLGWTAYQQLWRRVMLPETIDAVKFLSSQPADRFYFPPDLWAKIAYDFALVYNKGERDPEAVVQSLYPIYQGRLASFQQEVSGLTSVGRAGTVAAQAVEFQDLFPYFKYRWARYIPWVDSGEIR